MSADCYVCGEWSGCVCSSQLVEARDEIDALRTQLAAAEESKRALASILVAESGKPPIPSTELASRLAASEKTLVHASAELRHAYRCKDDWGLVARAIGILERAVGGAP